MISKDTTSISDYSIPNESRKCLWDGILNHGGHQSLPPECRKLFDQIEFVGDGKPKMAINWRFAESVASLKGFEAIVSSPAAVKLIIDFLRHCFSQTL